MSAGKRSALWRSGVDIAFKMLREIEAGNLEDMCQEGTYRAGRPQNNIAARYLAALRGLGVGADLAFGAVVTDYLATNVHAGEPNLDVTEPKFPREPFDTTRDPYDPPSEGERRFAEVTAQQVRINRLMEWIAQGSLNAGRTSEELDNAETHLGSALACLERARDEALRRGADGVRS
jgi:hypothetical protein